jgi:hypothetical protein
MSEPGRHGEISQRARNVGPSIPVYFESMYDMLPGVHLPLRSMFVPLRGILISPVGTAEEDAIMPSVRTLVEPSLLHHIHLAEARALAPVAEVWGPPGFAEKTHERGDIQVFGRDPWPHDAEVAALVIEGAPKRNEVVFLHRPTSTLYTADLVFNILGDAGMLAALSFRAMGIHRRFGVARMWKRWVTDRAAFDRSIGKLLEWDFDRIVMAHGTIVGANGKQMLIEALRERELLPH